MILTEFETDTALWRKVEKELIERLDTMRQRNDGALSEIETATLRGSIRTLKEILAWKQDPNKNTTML